MVIQSVLCILIFIIVSLCTLAVLQIKAIGLNVSDFWSFIDANYTLEKLYRFALHYDKLDMTSQVVFLMDAEKVFDAFDKVPNMLWEEEQEKYSKVLNTYRDIKLLRWAESTI